MKTESLDTPLFLAEDITAALLAMADPNHARSLKRFFKTGPGEYGEGDQFVGLKNPQVRLVVREAWKNTSLLEAVKLVKSPLHEVRLCGLLILVEKYLKALKAERCGTRPYPTADVSSEKIYQTYLSLHPYVNNWDLVDLSAIKIVGNQEVIQRLESPMKPTLMDEWIKPGHSLWQQRIAMVSTWMMIRHGMSEVATARAAFLFDSPHDLLHKAAGWMLREAWKHGYKQELSAFLETNACRMSSVMLSYACELMSEDLRRHFRQKRKASHLPLRDKLSN